MSYPLPYAFARAHDLLLEEHEQALSLWFSAEPDASAWSEVLRHIAPRNISHWHPIEKQALKQKISAVYSQGESSAATVANEVQSDVDLTRMMQELPAVEDLLESADDAPIIRLLNALLTQAAKEGASDMMILL